MKKDYVIRGRVEEKEFNIKLLKYINNMKKVFFLFVLLSFCLITIGQVKTERNNFQYQQYYDDGYVGIKNLKGKVIIPAFYNEIKYNNGLFVVKKDRFWGLFTKKGKVIIPANKYFKMTMNNEVDDSPYVFTGFTSWCAVSSKGKTLIPDDNYEVINLLGDKYNGLYFTFSKNGLWGVCDIDGNLIVPLKDYSYILRDGDKHNGFTYFYAKYGEGSGVLDEKGKEMIRTKYYVTRFAKDKTGNPGFTVLHGNSVGRLDLNGNLIYSPSSYEKKDPIQIPGTFTTSYFRVCNENNKYGIVNKNNTVIVPTEYDWVFPQNSHFIVRKGDSWGAYDFAGNQELGLTQLTVLTGFKDGLLGKKNAKWTAFDLKGNIILPLDYEGIDLYSKGNLKVFVVRSPQNHMYGLIGMDGKQIIPFSYDEIRMYREDANSDNCTFYIVIRDGKEGACNLMGQEIVSPIYTELGSFTLSGQHFFLATNGNKQGIIDFNGNTIIPAEYFTSISYLNNTFIATSGKRKCVFELSGKLLSDNLSDVECDKFSSLGDTEFEKENYKKAAEYYIKAVKYRTSAPLLFNIAVSYYNSGKYEDAIHYFNECLSNDPSQNLIDRSRSLIIKSRELQAEKIERRQQLAANIFGLVLGVTSALVNKHSNNNHQTSAKLYHRDTSLDYLLDPNYTIQQVQRENWYEYMRDTNGGKLMSYDEWYAKIKSPAIMAANDMDDDYSESSSNSSSGNQSSTVNSRGKSCRLCAGLGTCKTCSGRGYYYNPLDLRRTVACPNCHNHDGRCSSCGGTGYK